VALAMTPQAVADDLSSSMGAARPASVFVWSVAAAAQQTAVLAAQTVDVATRERLGTLMTAAADTPQKQGLVTVALADATIAVKQAWAAEQSPKDLVTMQAGARGVLQALDPALAKEGAASGYGVRPAVLGIIEQLRTLSTADTKADVMRTAPPALVAAQHVLVWCDAAIATARQIVAATRAADAAALTHALSTLTRQLAAGANTSFERHAIPAASEGGLLYVQLQLQMLKVGRDAAAAAPAPTPKVIPISEQPRPPIAADRAISGVSSSGGAR
jgi:hypothetical protein